MFIYLCSFIYLFIYLSNYPIHIIGHEGEGAM